MVPTLLGSDKLRSTAVESWSIRVGRDPRDGHRILFFLAKEGLRRYRGLSGGNRARYWWT